MLPRMKDYNHDANNISEACGLEQPKKAQDVFAMIVMNEVIQSPMKVSEEIQMLEPMCENTREALVIGWMAASARFNTRDTLNSKYTLRQKLDMWTKFLVALTLFGAMLYMIL
jgi:phosphoribosyl-AMP cyclohydrolase